MQGDKDNDSLSLRNFSIIEEKRGKWRYFRIVITDEPSAVKLTIDSEKEYEYSNNVKIALANTYIKFTATESGKYKFCYQEPAPVIT